MSSSDVGKFFDSLSEDYTRVIERAFPRYREMLQTLLDYLVLGLPIPDNTAHQDYQPSLKIMELGCGTGNLSVLIEQANPHAELTLIDLSAESVACCRQRLLRPQAHQCLVGDMRELSFDPSSFDAVVSTIAIHHIKAVEKRNLFASIYDWLKPNGCLLFADQFGGVSPTIYERHQSLWKQLSLSHGATPEEFELWMQHQAEHDHHDSLPDQLSWLRKASFVDVDCLWRFLLWTLVIARKPARTP